MCVSWKRGGLCRIWERRPETHMPKGAMPHASAPALAVAAYTDHSTRRRRAFPGDVGGSRRWGRGSAVQCGAGRYVKSLDPTKHPRRALLSQFESVWGDKTHDRDTQIDLGPQGSPLHPLYTTTAGRPGQGLRDTHRPRSRRLLCSAGPSLATMAVDTV